MIINCLKYGEKFPVFIARPPDSLVSTSYLSTRLHGVTSQKTTNNIFTEDVFWVVAQCSLAEVY
jgi:hypothetical protein